MRRMMPGLPIILSVLVSAAVGAQTPAPPAQAGVQQGVKVGKVYVSGENPVIRLLDKLNIVQLTKQRSLTVERIKKAA